MSQKYRAVASIHTHFNIFRDLHEAHEGDVTVAEQIKALERFVRWHERQVHVGNTLLTTLKDSLAAVEQVIPPPA